MKRIKKLGGEFKANSFDRLIKQIEGKGVLLVAIINTKCEDCQKLQDFINILKGGWIQKLPNLVVCYGYSNRSVDGEPSPVEDKKSPGSPEMGTDDKVKNQQKLGDSSVFNWEKIPDGHGYALYTATDNVQVYSGAFDHEEFKTNIVTAIRRYKSPVQTLAGLPGKRQFLEAKRSGIVIETSSSTANSEITALEAEVLKNESKLNVKVYFCKGITQEIALVKGGSVVFRQKGLTFEKFLKKMPRSG